MILWILNRKTAALSIFLFLNWDSHVSMPVLTSKNDLRFQTMTNKLEQNVVEAIKRLAIPFYRS